MEQPIRIGETHAVAHQINGVISRGLGQMDADATEAVKRLVEAVSGLVSTYYNEDLPHDVWLRETRIAVDRACVTVAPFMEAGE